MSKVVSLSPLVFADDCDASYSRSHHSGARSQVLEQLQGALSAIKYDVERELGTLARLCAQVQGCAEAAAAHGQAAQPECVDEDVWEDAAAQLLHVLGLVRSVLDALRSLAPLPHATEDTSLVAHTLLSIQVRQTLARETRRRARLTGPLAGDCAQTTCWGGAEGARRADFV